ncbi:MAG: sigma 54-interacting transcriptional regulator, partial [Holophagales bacterium]|nr:sigma 54-interacting transcriptional regulator [Holophagales bacterium]
CSEGAVERADPEEIRVPGSTVLYHLQRQRIGERIALLPLASGRVMQLSRLEPRFRGEGAGRGRPLEDLWISRRPATLAPGPTPGSVVISRSGTPTPIRIDGTELGAARTLSAGEIGRGVVILIGHSVLCLHETTPASAAGDAPDFGLVGMGPCLARMGRDIQRLAGHTLPILLRGEAGTGKYLAARAIHRAGERASRPFVAASLGAIPPPLVASELFGDTRCPRAGVGREAAGLIRQADGGTLFLGEIGETPPEVRDLLLRALERGRIQAVGGGDPETVDVRVIAASDTPIEKTVGDGRFGVSFSRRLSRCRMQLPALRHRREDLGLLLWHFCELECRNLGLDETTIRIPAPIVDRLARHPWPGNIPELRDAARRLVLFFCGRIPPPRVTKARW